MSDECGGWVRQAQPLKAIFSVYLSAMEAKALGSIGEKMKAAQLVYSDEVGGAIVPEDEGDFLTQLARDVLDGVLIINFCVIIEHKVYGLIAQAPTIFDLFRIVFQFNSRRLPPICFELFSKSIPCTLTTSNPLRDTGILGLRCLPGFGPDLPLFPAGQKICRGSAGKQVDAAGMQAEFRIRFVICDS